MVWGFIAFAIVIAVVLAGRAHSRYLDRQDELWADIIASGQRVVVTHLFRCAAVILAHVDTTRMIALKGFSLDLSLSQMAGYPLHGTSVTQRGPSMRFAGWPLHT